MYRLSVSLILRLAVDCEAMLGTESIASEALSAACGGCVMLWCMESCSRSDGSLSFVIQPFPRAGQENVNKHSITLVSETFIYIA